MPRNIYDITANTESGNRDFNKDGSWVTSPVGAKGRMQVMPGTITDPGFGVKPAKDNSPEELARVGRDYLDAMAKRYGGDMAKAWGAYNWGPGNLDRAIKSHGSNWLARAPEETRNYVAKNMRALGDAVDLPAPSQSRSRSQTRRDGNYWSNLFNGNSTSPGKSSPTRDSGYWSNLFNGK